MKQVYFALLLIAGIYTTYLPETSSMATAAIAANQAVKDGPSTSDYIVYQSFRLTKRLHGIDGRLQLLQDARLTEAHRSAMWNVSSDIDFVFNEDDELRKPFKNLPPLNAILRIVDRQGQVVEFEERAVLAELEEVKLYPSDRSTYLLTDDYSVGSGAYNGPITFFVEVVGGRFKWLEAIDKGTGQKKQISLMRSLKTAWKFVESASGKGKDILHVACRPDFDLKAGDDNFTVSYTRFHFNGKNWVKLTRQKEDSWESEGDNFPEQGLFPSSTEHQLAKWVPNQRAEKLSLHLPRCDWEPACYGCVR